MRMNPPSNFVLNCADEKYYKIRYRYKLLMKVWRFTNSFFNTLRVDIRCGRRYGGEWDSNLYKGFLYKLECFLEKRIFKPLFDRYMKSVNVIGKPKLTKSELVEYDKIRTDFTGDFYVKFNKKYMVRMPKKPFDDYLDSHRKSHGLKKDSENV